MKYSLSFFLGLCFLILAYSSTPAQQDKKPRTSLKASVMQRIGIDTDIKIDYSRPGVKGRKIWGELIPYGLATVKQNNKTEQIPWRGGANENTTIDFNKDVLVNGNKLPAGKYGLHFIPTENDWTVIFSKNSSSWGSYSYKQDEDALRIKVTPVKAPFQEWLEYGFDDLTGTSATAYLQWEMLKVPFKISVVE
jgi:hypothetical protein